MQVWFWRLRAFCLISSSTAVWDKLVIIRLRDIQCYAYHGVLEEEKQKGNTFLVGVSITIDDPQSMPSDDIQDTLDYRSVCAIVQREMQVPSNLLEHVAWRIKNALLVAFPQASKVKVTVAKQAPPLDLPVAWAEVEI
ncbi:MAG: dihydroneopterin aldolase [Bacteroidales bacterium]|nr:dihydroneopterin aldolase [Bacteroidales bacterium]